MEWGKRECKGINDAKKDWGLSSELSSYAYRHV